MKPIRTYTLIFIFGLITVWSCTEKIDLNLETISPKIVIEGSISNLEPSQTVKITRTSGYFDPTRPEAVTGAAVTLSDNLGNQIDFQEVSAGIYTSYPNNGGVPGREYTLTVVADQQVYVASSVMPRAPSVDSINFSADPDKSLLFHIRLYALESAIPGNCYFFGVFNESIYQSDNLTKKVFANDQLINGQYLFGLPVQTVEAKPGNRITLQVASIPEDFYQYCLAVLRVTVYNDNPFEQAPANVPGNFSGGALGYFYAFSETRVTRIIRIAN